MTTLEKLSSLKHYMVGKTFFPDDDRRYMASIFEQSAIDFDVDINEEYQEDIVQLEVLYAPTMEEVISMAYEKELDLI